MVDQREERRSGVMRGIGAAALGLVIVVIFLLPPVKRWFNETPYLLEILYPLLTLFSLYLLYQAYRAKAGTFALFKWALLLVAALSSMLAVYGAGAIFYTIRLVSAEVFIVLQIGHILVESFFGVSR
jgi:FtsH-binding integral membrane protein